MYNTLETLRVCGVLLQPVMPTSMKALLDRLGSPQARMARDAAFGSSGNHALGQSTGHLFRKF